MDGAGPRRRRGGGRRRAGRTAFFAAMVAASAAALAQACTNKDVVGVQVGSVRVQPPSVTLFEGDSTTLTAVVREVDGSTLQNAAVTWSGAPTSVVSVDETGEVKGLVIGEAQVTAEFQGVQGTARVNVIKGPTIEVEPSEVTFFGGVDAPAPAPAAVDVGNSGGGTLGGLEATVEYPEGGSSGWLTAELAAGAAPTELTLTPATAELPVGVHEASVVLSSAVAHDGPAVVEVTLSLTGLAIVESDGGTAVDETGTTDTIRVSLRSAPDADVVLDVVSGDLAEVTAAPTRLTFTPDDWDQAKEVVVTGVDDPGVDGTQPVAVTLSVDPDASDAAFHPIPDAVVTVAVADDDGAGFTVSPTALSVDEAAGTQTFTVELRARPATQVVFTVVSSDEAEAVTDASTLTFTAADWDPQTVTVTGVDDAEDDDDQTSTITVAVDEAASDDEFHGLPAGVVTVTTLDDDGVGVRVEESEGTTVVGEDLSTDSFTVVLQSDPVASVVVDVTSGDIGEAVVDRATLTFTTANWDVPQTVVVTGVDDGLTDGDQQTAVSVTVDPIDTDDEDYDGLIPRTVTVTTLDDEQAEVLVTETGGSTQATEGGATDQIRVRLSAEPVTDVVIDVTSDNTADLTAAPTPLTFTPADWDAEQVVTVTAVDEVLVDGQGQRTITFAVNGNGSDDAYDGIVVEVEATTVDDDAAGFSVAHTNGSTSATEAGVTDTMLVVLTSRPLTDVVLTVTSDDADDATVSPMSLRFTNANWNVTQPVVLTAVNDDVIDPGPTRTITFAVDDGESDAAFDPLANKTLSATTVDDDQAGFTVDEIGVVSVQEDRGEDIFTVVLTAQPSSNVVLALAWDAAEIEVDRPTLTFTPGNWDTPQTVTVTGVNDDIGAEQSTEITISVNAAASDDAFDGLADYVVDIGLMDDDAVGFNITELAGTVVTEAGGTDEFGVTLNTQPVASVVLTVTSPDVGEATVDPSTLTFTNANWNQPQPVTVTGVNDFVDDGDVVTLVTVAVDVGASDAEYEAVAPRTVSVTTRDDDVAGFTLTQTGVATSAPEGGAADSIRVVLTSQPITNVLIDVAVDQPAGRGPDAALSPGTLTFTSANWNTPQRVAFSAVDDDLVDGDLGRTVTFTIDPSSDDTFDPLAAQTAPATTVDDDAAGFTITPTGGSTLVDESATTDEISVVLSAEPTTSVVITVQSDDIGEATVSPPSLTFTAADWDDPQTVTVTGVDETTGPLVDGDQQSTLTFAVDASSDAAFVGVAAQTSQVTTTDGDLAGFTATAGPAGTTATEGGANGSVQVVLTAQPVGNVVLTLASDDPADATVNPAQVTFTNANWNVPQTAVITAVNEPTVDGTRARTITVAVSDGLSDNAFDPLANQVVGAQTVDDDAAGFTVSPTGGSTTATEGGPGDTFTVVLDRQPLTNVVFDVSTDDAGDATVSPGTLTFGNGNWNVPQTVTFSAFDDDAVDGSQDRTITVSVRGANSDDAFDGLPAQTLEATTQDDDVGGLVVNEMGGLSVSEVAGSDAFTVTLSSQPLANVVIDVASDPTELLVSPTTITFEPDGWNDPRTVTVTGVDDEVASGNLTDSVYVAVAGGSDGQFLGLADTVAVTIVDDDVPGFVVTETQNVTRVTEAGGDDEFLVRLNTQPSTAVVLTLSSADPGEVVLDSTTLTFTPADWDDAKTVVVTGVDDQIDDGDVATLVTIGVNVGASDPIYGSVSQQSVGVVTEDDDQAGFTLSQATVAVTEAAGAGHTASFTAVLTAQPITDVVLDVTSNATDEAAVSPATVTFTNANWNQAQTVTVTGQDDDLVDGAQQAVITVAVNAAASDNAFDAVAGQAVTATTADNDAAGFTLSQSTVAVTEAAGAGHTATFTAALTAQPSTNVVLTVNSSATDEATVDPATLTFTNANWNVAQTVTVTGQDDNLVDGPQQATITVAVNDAASDNAFDGVGDKTVTSTTADNDVAGFTLSQSTVAVTEAAGAGHTATFTAALTAQPSTNVVLTVNSNATDEATVNPATLTFTNANWNVAQTVTVTGQDDDIIDGPQNATITIAVDDAASDNAFDGVGDKTVTSTTADNDVAGFTLSQSTVAVTEAAGAGHTATVTAVLTAQPIADVVLTVTSNATDEATVNPATLTFTNASWNVAQTVTVTGQDDDIIDGPQNATITIAVDDAASDNAFDAVAGQAVTATTADNDVADFTLSQATVAVTEAAGAGHTATFTAVLTAQPTTDVVLTVTSNATDEATVDPATLTFTNANWNVAQNVTVTGQDDNLVDGPQQATITVAVNAAASDNAFDAVAGQTVTATTADDDAAGFTLAGQAGASVTEGATTDEFTVVLTSEPTSNVVFTISSAGTDEATVNPTTLTFLPAEWDTPKPVTITGANDDVDDGDQTTQITVSVDDAASDNTFDALPNQSFNVTTVDDDAAGFTLSGTTSVSVGEGSSTSFTVVLESQPAAGQLVVLTVESDNTNEVAVDSLELTFDATMWDVPKTIVITGVPDGIPDLDQLTQVTLALDIGASDPAYALVAPQSFSVTTINVDAAAEAAVRPRLNDAFDGLSTSLTVTTIDDGGP